MEIRPIILSLKHNKVLSLLIIVQVAFTLAVVSNSLFVTTATLKEWNLPSGLDHGNIVLVQPQFFDLSVDTRQVVLDDLEKFRQLPGVVNVTTSSQTPFAAESVSEVYLETGDEPQSYQTNIFDLDIGGFEVLGLQLIEGRQFNESEVVRHDPTQSEAKAAVVMISQDQAEALFPGESALGRTIWLEANEQPVEVIGVYSNFMNGESLNFQGMSFNTIIRPMVSWHRGEDPNYLIRVEDGMAVGLFDEFTKVIYETKGRYLYRVERLTRTQKRMYDGRGSNAATFMVISLVLVLISGLGMAGLVSFLVNQRQKQIGIRRAMGATRFAVTRYFLVENSILTLTGLFLGGVLTLAITYALTENTGENILQVKYLFIVALGLWLVNLVAVFVPARRAAMIDPAIVTRSA
jgi:putative ABC transport system permease protein